jgi:hypothetical protein
MLKSSYGETIVGLISTNFDFFEYIKYYNGDRQKIKLFM